MTNKKRKPPPFERRHIARLEQQLKAIEAQIARLEKDRSLGLAEQDHFILWRRPNLFTPWSAELPH